MKEQDPTKETVQNLRRDLNYEGLKEQNVPQDPFALFSKWLEAAVANEPYEPNAMTLATASKDGKPTARTVLLKDYGPDGFVFYTNFGSRKGRDLQENPQASLVLYWGSLSRQVLIDGKITGVDREIAKKYFHSRPRNSQIAAYTSDQSQVVDSREALDSLIKQTEEKFKDQEIPLPDNWGGFCLKPERIEFWQGQNDRLHDRLCYTKQSKGWKLERLAP